MIAFAAGVIAGLALAKANIVSQEPTDLAAFVAKTSRGGLNIPAQWFEMQTVVGWEKMMLVVGYADNQMVCNHTIPIAEAESPDRDFRCSPAN